MERLKSAVEIATERGWQAGRQEGIEQVILNMLQNNLDMSLICKVTGLSPEEIKKLQTED